MSIYSKILNMDGVYWQQAGVDQYGKMTYKDPVQIKCHWADVQESYVRPDNTQATSNAQVFVDRDMQPEDCMMLGTLDLVTDTSIPLNNTGLSNSGASIVQKYERIPNLRGTKYLRSAWL